MVATIVAGLISIPQTVIENLVRLQLINLAQL